METMKMEDEVWMIDKHLCRCCHLEGKFKSLASTDLLMENKMLFKDALRFGLDIELCPVEGPLADAVCTICESCVERLREACSFRNQVLKCEERFQYLYSEDLIKVASSEPVVEKVIKQELPDPEDSDNEGNHDEGMDKSIDEAGSDTSTDPPKVVESKLFELLTGGKKKPIVYKLRASDYEKIGEKIKCTRCDKIYSKINSLRIHIKSVHLKLRGTYDCDFCNTPFYTMNTFIKHKLDVHKIDDRFKCNACDKVYNSKTQLTNHKNNFHMLGEKHKCPQCDYESFSVISLYKHKYKHKTVKDYTCKFCKKSFVRKSNLNLHERIHTGERRKVCAECGKAFVQKASLNYHMTKYHPAVKF